MTAGHDRGADIGSARPLAQHRHRALRYVEIVDIAQGILKRLEIAADTVRALFRQYGVHYIFAGHYHRNSFGRDGDLEMTTTGPAGMALGTDGSGFRIAEVSGASIRHAYYGLGSIPNTYPPPPVKP